MRTEASVAASVLHAGQSCDQALLTRIILRLSAGFCRLCAFMYFQSRWTTCEWLAVMLGLTAVLRQHDLPPDHRAAECSLPPLLS